MSQENRAQTMAAKLTAYARRARVADAPVLAAYSMALEPRLRGLGDIFHPDLLHPARNVLILLEDAACRDAEVLAAAALTETEFPELRVAAEQIRGALGNHVADLVQGIPQPRELGAELTEALVSLPEPAALIAVAERLDHARHLHFRAPEAWRPFHQQVVDVYLPFAARLNTALWERLARWAGAFERRLDA